MLLLSFRQQQAQKSQKMKLKHSGQSCVRLLQLLSFAFPVLSSSVYDCSLVELLEKGDQQPLVQSQPLISFRTYLQYCLADLIIGMDWGVGRGRGVGGEDLEVGGGLGGVWEGLVRGVQQQSMQGESKMSSLEGMGLREMKKSNLSEWQPERAEGMAALTGSRKQLSSSTFLKLNEDRSDFRFIRKTPRKQTEYLPQSEELKRARSLKSMEEGKFLANETPPPPANDLQDNVLKLKLEEMVFKIRTKLGSLLKEIGTSGSELQRFSGLGRIDDMLSFLGEKVRERLLATEITSDYSLKQRSKDKEVLDSTAVELDSLRKKLTEKEAAEKVMKAKQRDLHAQTSDWQDRFFQKDREVSEKMTEIYQLRATEKETEKLVEGLQIRIAGLEKQRSELRNRVDEDGRGAIKGMTELQDEVDRLREELAELQEDIQRINQKDAKLIEANRQLSNEVVRWRERFEEERGETAAVGGSSEGSPAGEAVLMLGNELKKSTMSMSNYFESIRSNSNSKSQSATALEIDNTRLMARVRELEKANKQLTRDMLNYATVKEKYQQEIEEVPTGVEAVRERNVDVAQLEREAQLKRRIEAVAREWKDKLYEVVHKYEDDLELLRQDIARLTNEKQATERKLHQLANEKYLLENKLIQREQELYQLTSRSTSSITVPHQEKPKEQPRGDSPDVESEQLLLGSDKMLLSSGSVEGGA